MSRSTKRATVEFTPPQIPALEVERRRFSDASRLAPLTIENYRRDWRVFTAWCRAAQRAAIPADLDTVTLYLTDLIHHRGRVVATAARHQFAIAYTHREAGLPSPCGPATRALLVGAKRLLAQRPKRKKAFSVEQLRTMIAAIKKSSASQARDRAILVFGFATALRRSNIVSLHMEDLTFVPGGFLVSISHEKQDRRGYGRVVPIAMGTHAATCPLRTLNAWLKVRGRHPGPLFVRVYRGKISSNALGGDRISGVVKEAVTRIGLDPKLYGAHSMRRSFVTQAIRNKVGEFRIAEHTGHRSLQSLRDYYETSEMLRKSVGREVGL